MFIFHDYLKQEKYFSLVKNQTRVQNHYMADVKFKSMSVSEQLRT